MNKSRRINSYDVARLAGVSQSAVSRTFTPGASVSNKTREKVLSAAHELGYRPNAIARSLITRRSQIVAVGRYRQGGVSDVTLSGYVNDKLQTFVFQEQVFVDDFQFTNETTSAIPRLWATRKIGYLLNQIRLHGPDQETIDQIVRLSIRYGIVTPYTSYLVTEEMPLGAAGQERIAGEQFDALKAMPSAPVSGEAAVERAMMWAAGKGKVGDLVDLGTGTGRVLEVFAPRLGHGIGIDQSHEMLTVARANLDARAITNCHVRRGSVYDVPLPSASADVVTVHHVLHFLDDPAAAIKEATRLLRPGGRLLVVDFAPHEMEFLRNEYAHRRLGFADEEVKRWCRGFGLDGIRVRHLEAVGRGDRSTLTVSLWSATSPSSPSSRRTRQAVKRGRS